METANLYLICGISFFIVFFILAVLAVIMRLIILVFPEKKGIIDAPVIAAVLSVFQTAFPGTKITKIEEKK